MIQLGLHIGHLSMLLNERLLLFFHPGLKGSHVFLSLGLGLYEAMVKAHCSILYHLHIGLPSMGKVGIPYDHRAHGCQVMEELYKASKWSWLLNVTVADKCTRSLQIAYHDHDQEDPIYGFSQRLGLQFFHIPRKHH